MQQSSSSNGVPLLRTAPCPSAAYCRGGTLQRLVTSENSSSSSSSVTTLGVTDLSQQCQFPRAAQGNNLLCGACVDGYVEWNNECKYCTEANGGYIFLVLIISFCLVLFLLRSSSAGSSGDSTIFLYFIQTAMLQVGNTSSSSSNNNHSLLLNWISFINFSPTSSVHTCLAPIDPYQ